MSRSSVPKTKPTRAAKPRKKAKRPAKGTPVWHLTGVLHLTADGRWQVIPPTPKRHKKWKKGYRKPITGWGPEFARAQAQRRAARIASMKAAHRELRASECARRVSSARAPRPRRAAARRPTSPTSADGPDPAEPPRWRGPRGSEGPTGAPAQVVPPPLIPRAPATPAQPGDAS